MSKRRKSAVKPQQVSRIDHLKATFPKISEETFNTIIKADPTYRPKSGEPGKYGKWLLSRYNQIKKFKGLSEEERNKITLGPVEEKLAWIETQQKLFLENLYKTKRDLKLFDRFKLSLPEEKRDIGHIETCLDLYDVVVPLAEIRKIFIKDEMLGNLVASGEIDLVYKNKEFIVIIPKTWEASQKVAGDTRWCTARGTDDTAFEEYTEDGPLFILLSQKEPGQKYQFCFHEKQFMDREDRPIPDFEEGFLHARPDLADFFKSYAIKNKYRDILSYLDKRQINDLKKITDKEEAIWIAITYPKYYHYLSTTMQTDIELVHAFVKKDGMNYYHLLPEIQKRADVKEIAFETNGMILKELDHTRQDDEETVLHAIRQSHGMAFKYASKRLREDKAFILRAVKEHSMAYTCLAEKQRKDTHIALAAFSEVEHFHASKLSESLPISLQENPEILRHMVRANKDLYDDLPYAMKNNNKIVTEFVLKGGDCAQIPLKVYENNALTIDLIAKKEGYAFILYNRALKFTSAKPSIKHAIEIMIAVTKEEGGRLVSYQDQEILEFEFRHGLVDRSEEIKNKTPEEINRMFVEIIQELPNINEAIETKEDAENNIFMAAAARVLKTTEKHIDVYSKALDFTKKTPYEKAMYAVVETAIALHYVYEEKPYAETKEQRMFEAKYALRDNKRAGFVKMKDTGVSRQEIVEKMIKIGIPNMIAKAKTVNEAKKAVAQNQSVIHANRQAVCAVG